MTAAGGPEHDPTPVYVISVAASLAGMHPQTLRTYDRLGLVSPDRTAGRNRRYSARDISTLLEVARLSAEGVNLEGIRRIIELSRQVNRLTDEVAELREELARGRVETEARISAAHASHRRELVPVERGSLVIWRR